MSTDRDRVRFEDAVFAHYERIRSLGWRNATEGDGSRESLFWLQPNGQYGVLSVEHAWWGWKLNTQASLPVMETIELGRRTEGGRPPGGVERRKS